jgi:hypothetical protein
VSQAHVQVRCGVVCLRQSGRLYAIVELVEETLVFKKKTLYTTHDKGLFDLSYCETKLNDNFNNAVSEFCTCVVLKINRK